MKWLAIDTSTERASIALAVGDDVYHEEHGTIREHASTILPIIARLLKQAELDVRQLDGVIFGRGPGSFTGLRIACSVVKGLAYPHDLPVYPVSGLRAIAQSVSSEKHVLVMIDARMQEVYWAGYSATSAITEEYVTPASNVVIPGEAPLILAGVGLESYLALLPEAIKGRITTMQTVYPDAFAMIRCVQQGGIAPVTAAEALPVYIRNQVVHVKGARHG